MLWFMGSQKEIQPCALCRVGMRIAAGDEREEAVACGDVDRIAQLVPLEPFRRFGEKCHAAFSAVFSFPHNLP